MQLQLAAGQWPLGGTELICGRSPASASRRLPSCLLPSCLGKTCKCAKQDSGQQEPRRPTLHTHQHRSYATSGAAARCSTRAAAAARSSALQEWDEGSVRRSPGAGVERGRGHCIIIKKRRGPCSKMATRSKGEGPRAAAPAAEALFFVGAGAARTGPHLLGTPGVQLLPSFSCWQTVEANAEIAEQEDHASAGRDPHTHTQCLHGMHRTAFCYGERTEEWDAVAAARTQAATLRPTPHGAQPTPS